MRATRENLGKKFTFEAGRLSLSFVATVMDRHGQAFDKLWSPKRFSEWCRLTGIAESPISVSSEQLAQSKELREAIYRLVHSLRAHQAPASQDVELINSWAERMPFVPALQLDGRKKKLVSVNAFASSLSAIAADAIDLVTSPELEKVRECEGSECSMLFVDRSRPGARRWCSMSMCGNRDKKRSFRQRSRLNVE